MSKIPKLLPVGVLLCLLAGASGLFAETPQNRLPSEVLQALRAPAKVVLYSLEPPSVSGKKENVFFGFKILGRVDLGLNQAGKAIGEFKSAVSAWNGVTSECFDPRHALRVTAAGHTYDLLLCYECHHLDVFRDGKYVVSLGATGSPKVLNGILSAAGVPLAKREGAL